MNGIQEFVNKDFGTIRTVIIDNEPWFVAKDVCNILGIANPTDALNKGLEDFERARFNLGRQGEANIVSESGFYTLVLRSRKPIAKPFRLWVTQEILPQIRKTGGYIPIKESEPDELIMARAVQIANETIKHKDEIIANQKKRIKSLEETEKDWKLLMDTKGTFSVNEIAHFIGIGEYTLFASATTASQTAYVQCQWIVVVTDDFQDYYLQGYQDTGAVLNVTSSYMRAVRIA